MNYTVSNFISVIKVALGKINSSLVSSPLYFVLIDAELP